MYFYLMWIFIPCVSLGVYSTWFSFLESHCDWVGRGKRERESEINYFKLTSVCDIFISQITGDMLVRNNYFHDQDVIKYMTHF